MTPSNHRFSTLAIVVVLAACGDSTGVGGSGAGAAGGGGSGASDVGGSGAGGQASGGEGAGGGGGPADGGGGGGGDDTCYLDAACDPSLADQCLCEGCGDGSVCDENVDCICPACAEDKFCSDPELCLDDGACDPYGESCACADCAGVHPLCPG